ncbi:MAG: dTDP-4-dehydrorhamnose reductase [Xanthomonadales bacterium]|nr:dTDP-4-dehydrorhamnose reductase [Xanthomonadales bacterium]|tara:strand:+ start:502 stop:1398 length:897 start_codon:yes stop_codon:yes gene_type:complete
MRILLTGCGGQLGRHLAPRLARLGEVIATDREGGDFQCDLSDRRLLDKTLHRVKPDVVVNPAAWTAVDRAEDEPELAARMNRAMPGWIAAWCAQNDALMLHFSTDYVFSGPNDRPWSERDEPSPGNVYGRTKLDSERAIAASGAHSVIVRTAWLYSHFPGNFLSAILTRAGQGQPLKIVSDQFGSPTWAGHLADATTALLERRDRLPDRCSLFHVAGKGCMSWHEFGQLAVERAVEIGALDKAVPVSPIESANWPQKAKRPVWSVLDCSRYEEFTGLELPSVERGLDECLAFWKESIC